MKQNTNNKQIKVLIHHKAKNSDSQKIFVYFCSLKKKEEEEEEEVAKEIRPVKFLRNLIVLSCISLNICFKYFEK